MDNSDIPIIDDTDPAYLKRRGRPKKTVAHDSPDDNLIKKRGRKRRTELVRHNIPITVNDAISDMNYIVMLDIKYTDLEINENLMTRVEGVAPSDKQECSFQRAGVGAGASELDIGLTEGSGKCDIGTTCSGLINSFLRILSEKQRIYENFPTLKPVHGKIITPDTSPVNFYSNFDQRQVGCKVLPIFELCGDGWPTHSNYACWNCDSQFDNPPIGIPEYVNNNQFYCSGNFCSFPCTARYIIDNDNTCSRFEKISLLNTLYQMAFDYDLTTHVIAANPKQTLHKYGGTLSYSQYHSEKSQNVHIYKLPIVPLYYHLWHNIDDNEIETEHLRNEVKIGGQLRP